MARPFPVFCVGQGRGGSDSESDPDSIWILNLALRRQLAAGGDKIAGDVDIGIGAVEAVVEYQLREQQQQRRKQSAAGEQLPQHMCESNRFRLTADRVAVLFVRPVALHHSPSPAANSRCSGFDSAGSSSGGAGCFTTGRSGGRGSTVGPCCKGLCRGGEDDLGPEQTFAGAESSAARERGTRAQNVRTSCPASGQRLDRADAAPGPTCLHRRGGRVCAGL